MIIKQTFIALHLIPSSLFIWPILLFSTLPQTTVLNDFDFDDNVVKEFTNAYGYGESIFVIDESIDDYYSQRPFSASNNLSSLSYRRGLKVERHPSKIFKRQIAPLKAETTGNDGEGGDNYYDDITTLKPSLLNDIPDFDQPAQVFVRIGAMIPFFGSFPFALNKVYGASLLALRKINDGILRDIIVVKDDISNRGNKLRAANRTKKYRVAITMTYVDTGSDGAGKLYYQECTEEFATFHATNLFYESGVSAFLGPMCYLTFVSVAYLASRWEIPLITSLGPGIANPVAWPTAIRTGFRTTDIVRSILAILGVYGWNDYVFLYEELPKNLGLSSLDYSVQMIQNSLPTPASTYKLNSSRIRSDVNMLYPLLFGSTFARIFVLEMSINATKQLLLDAYDMGLLIEGEYVFIATELWRCSCFGGTFFDFENDERVEDLKKAYESLLVITVKQEDDKDVKAFKGVIKSFSKQLTAFNYGFVEEDLSVIVTGLFDGLLLYATALKEHLEDGGIITEGNEIVRRMRDTRFYSEMGETKIGPGGDKIADYIIWDFDTLTAKWKPALLFSSEQNILLPYEEYDIQWPSRQDSPLNEPDCGFRSDNPTCFPLEPISMLGIFIILLFVVLIFCTLFALYAYKRLKLEAELADRWWEAKIEDIKLYHGKSATSLSLRRSQLATNIDESNDERENDQSENDVKSSKFSLFSAKSVATGEYKGIHINLKDIKLSSKFRMDRHILLEFKYLRDIQHANLCRFVAIAFDLPKIYVLMEHCHKGTLKELLKNDTFQMDMEMKTALIRDIIAGMMYLHQTPIQFHGNLRTNECFIDSRFSLKISGYGLNSIRKQQIIRDTESKDLSRKFWLAPEFLIADYVCIGSQKGDVYSFGIIVEEVMTRCAPFLMPLDERDQESIGIESSVTVEKVGGCTDSSPHKPSLDIEDESRIPDDWKKLAGSCLRDIPELRPTFQQINSTIREMNKGKIENVVENLLKRMEVYANNLEVLVDKRTSAYIEQKKKTDDLLYRIMPISVAEKLKQGLVVEPVSYEGVTIYFSDIVGFTSMSSESTPFQVVTFLNDLYTCFDSILFYYDVYKVETIGDAYMVVSGAPIQNGMNHAKEISRVSLALLHAIKAFKIRHKPKTQLKLRIGIHSGPVAAGVVGLKMPRYCLFGYTVNTASCMESSGEALKIHVSPDTEKILEQFGNFVLEPRGPIELKDKRIFSTFWLIGEKDANGHLITYDLKTIKNMKATSNTLLTTVDDKKLSRKIENNRKNLLTSDINDERYPLLQSHSATETGEGQHYNSSHHDIKSRLTASLAKIHHDLVARSADFIIHSLGIKRHKKVDKDYEQVPLQSKYEPAISEKVLVDKASIYKSGSL